MLNDILIMNLDEAARQFPEARVVGGIGSPKIRQAIVEKASSRGFDFETIVHQRTEASRWIEIGLGTVICAGNILTTNISLGSHGQINLDCTIGQDVIMGEFVTLAPG